MVKERMLLSDFSGDRTIAPCVVLFSFFTRYFCVLPVLSFML